MTGHRPWRMIPITDEELLRRMWSYVDKSAGPDACWPWKGGVNDNHYSIFHDGKNSAKSVRRMVFFGVHETPDDKRYYVLLTCPNANRCCNPSHMYKSLFKYGTEKNPNINSPEPITRKLTENKVREIRRLYSTGEFTQARLGLKFKVSTPTINAIVRRQTWRFTK